MCFRLRLRPNFQDMLSANVFYGDAGSGCETGGNLSAALPCIRHLNESPLWERASSHRGVRRWSIQDILHQRLPRTACLYRAHKGVYICSCPGHCWNKHSICHTTECGSIAANLNARARNRLIVVRSGKPLLHLPLHEFVLQIVMLEACALFTFLILFRNTVAMSGSCSSRTYTHLLSLSTYM